MSAFCADLFNARMSAQELTLGSSELRARLSGSSGSGKLLTGCFAAWTSVAY